MPLSVTDVLRPLLMQKVTTDGADEDPELAEEGSPVAIVTFCALICPELNSPDITIAAARTFVLKERSKFLLRMNVIFCLEYN